MRFEPNNHVVMLCAKGMEMEGTKPEAALKLFLQAWNESQNSFEKFIAAHYVARHQPTVKDKLEWDERALEFALQPDDDDMKSNFPSLYLNIAKCYEDLRDRKNSLKNYQAALSFANALPDDGYGRMIKSGIEKGIERVSKL